MAAVLKFTRVSTDTNLLNTAGWYVLDPGWIPKVAEIVEGYDPPPVEEVLKISSNFATQDALAAGVVVLNKLGRDAQRYMVDRTETTPIWFHDQLTSETGQRRALVRRIRLQPLSEQHGIGGGEGNMIDAHAYYMLGVERGPYWEAPTDIDLAAMNETSAASIAYDYTASADIVGDAPGRFYQLLITTGTGAGMTVGRLWIGLRSAQKHGTLSNFKPIWECEDTDCALGTDAARAADTTASPGGATNKKVTVTPGTATWAKRLTMELQDFTSYAADNFGQYLGLLRNQVSAGTWEIQARFGMTGWDDADFIRGPIQSITSTAWDYTPIGVYDIPMIDMQASMLNGLFAIQIWARRTVGAGTLDLDCLCPIPLDEGFLIVSDGQAALGEGTFFYMSPKGTTAVVSGTNSVMPAYQSYNFRLPPGDGRMIIVYARATSSVLADTIAVASSSAYFPCWYTLRGSEGT